MYHYVSDFWVWVFSACVFRFFFRTVFADSWCFMGLRRRGEGGQTQHVLGRPHRARDPDEGKKREMEGETIRKEHKETKISKMK